MLLKLRNAALAALGAATLLAMPLCGATATRTELDTAFDRLYSFDFEGSRAAAGLHLESNAADPLGYAVRSASYLFSELNRLNALGSGFLSEEKVKSQAALKPDPKAREGFWSDLNTAKRLAGQTLSAKPRDRDALLALAISCGLERDYTALIDKKLRQSLEHIKCAQDYSVRLLKVDPTAADAYLNTGFSEYLLGSFPFFLRWVVKIDGVEGNKEKGLALLEKAANEGRYMKAFAQLLLANFYQKEKRLRDSERVLRALASAYPENEAIRRELLRLSKRS